MKTIYVQDLFAGQVISGETFAVKSVAAATDKNGKPYYDLELADKTGEIKAKIWSDVLSAVDNQALKAGKVVAVEAHVEQYRGALQLTIISLQGVDESALEEYLEASEYDPEEMWQELMKVVSQISNCNLKQLLDKMFADPELVRKFKYWPAAITIHHAFRSGLLQHTLEMMTIAGSMPRFYPDLDMDLLRTAIILHDIGKLEELDASGLVAQFSQKGSLIGHIVLGVEIFERYLPEKFPEELKLQLQHMILSHQGTKEFGSPVLPATLEAIVLSEIDDLSFKARAFVEGLKAPRDEAGFTAYNRWLGTKLWSAVTAAEATGDV
jgi:3'-5' exoribonuclease